ncbi:Uncharacterised protein [Vibrio cholerae]|nr:Uncharacterised protein [Vibrio cholerae]CSI38009.1 Uncharacterised protein [Vibrio cholerae]CSI65918.1 Uncharacterised protein [Vibrio cholerae]
MLADQFFHRGIHIHFHQEVHTTTQIKAEFHWCSTN